jgi:hypothetical protein
VLSVRQFVALSKAWPAELPSNGGYALVVAGFEGCLDALSNEDAALWVEGDLRNLCIDFERFYEQQTALILWMPTGRHRWRYELAADEYVWLPHRGDEIPLGRMLWSGARRDAQRILIGGSGADHDGEGWIGMYHRRLDS